MTQQYDPNHTRVQLSEICDFQGPEGALEVLKSLTKHYIVLPHIEAPFEIAELTIEEGIGQFGASGVLRYIYDFALEEAERTTGQSQHKLLRFAVSLRDGVTAGV